MSRSSHRSFNARFPLAFCLLSVTAGCTTTAGGDHRGNTSSAPTNSDQAGPNGPGTGVGGGTGVAAVAMGAGGSGTVIAVPPGAVVGPTMLRRLTNIEYKNTVQSLLNLPTNPTEPLQTDALTRGFDNFAATLTVPPALAKQYWDLSAQEAANAFVVPACAASEMEPQCASAFVGTFGKRAFRRPLSPHEQKAYEALYADQRTRADYAGGIRQVVQTMLQSPYLLYRFELGTAGSDRALTPHEVATQLSYLATATTPDDALLTAADANALLTPAQIEQQARRLLSQPASKPNLQRFVLSFADTLNLDNLAKDATEYPLFTSDLRTQMQAETARFIDTILWEGDGSFSSLLSAPFSFINGKLASFYGVTDPGQGDTLIKTSLNPLERQGLLTQASVLAAHSKPGESGPVMRGKFVRVGLLCQNLPAPPPNVPKVQPPQPGLTTRERFAQHSADPACAGCHTLIDPLGFGLENYDGIGQFRSTESGKPVDASGSVSGTVDIDGPFTGGVELSTKLAASLEAKQCMTEKAYSWAFGRAVLDAERPVVSAIATPLVATGLDLREVMVAIAKADNFRFRSFH